MKQGIALFQQPAHLKEMAEKFLNKYRIGSTRLQRWDYGWNAAYFVTICTKNRAFFFGEINDRILKSSPIGELAFKFWYEIPDHFPFVELGAFVVMPNHVHGILIINKNNANVGVVETRQCLVSTTPTGKTPGQKRFRNQGKNTLSSIIGSYKSVVTKHARKIRSDFAWQSRFYDHIIRNDRSFRNIRAYILNNPKNWNN